MQRVTLTAQTREKAGKGVARATRRAGLLPGVIYGDKKAPTLIAMDPRQLTAQLKIPGFFARQFQVEVDGAKHLTVCQDVQTDPLNDLPIHVDFLRISLDRELHVSVPVHFINEEESPGLRRGGTLNVVRYEIEVICKPDSMPETIEADLSGLDLGDGLHISHITLPEGVRPAIEDRDFTIATIATPSGLKSEMQGEDEGGDEASAGDDEA